MFLLSRDAFSFFVMGFTGEKAAKWKLAYIKAFNEMERRLRERQFQLPDFTNPAEAARAWAKEYEEKMKALKKLQEQKPLVNFAKNILKSKDSILVRELAKIISDEGFNIGQNRLYKYLRENGYLMKNNEPYQKYIDKGYFVVQERSINTPYGEKIIKTTKVTPKGQVAIVERIIEEMKK